MEEIRKLLGNFPQKTTLNSEVLEEVGSSDPRILTVINPSDKQFKWPTEWPIDAVGGLSTIRKAMYGEN